jgi:hypothetical protein
MAETVLKLMEAGHIQIIPQSKGGGKQFYRMPAKLRQETEKKLGLMVENLSITEYAQ